MQCFKVFKYKTLPGVITIRLAGRIWILIFNLYIYTRTHISIKTNVLESWGEGGGGREDP